MPLIATHHLNLNVIQGNWLNKPIEYFFEFYNFNKIKNSSFSERFYLSNTIFLNILAIPLIIVNIGKKNV